MNPIVTFERQLLNTTANLVQLYKVIEPHCDVTIGYNPRWDDTLTPDAIAALTPAQKRVLRIGRPFELDSAFAPEREREAGVRGGTLEELAAEVATEAARL